MKVLNAGRLGPVYTGNKEILLQFCPSSISVYVQDYNEDVSFMSTNLIAISTHSLNMQVKNTSRRHQEGTTAEAANWAGRHYHTIVS